MVPAASFSLTLLWSSAVCPALVPGFVAGMIVIQGLPINPNTGMIDAMRYVGFASWVVLLAASLLVMSSLVLRSSLQVFQRTPDGLKAPFLYPLLSTTVLLAWLCWVLGPMAINTRMMKLRGLFCLVHLSWSCNWLHARI